MCCLCVFGCSFVTLRGCKVQAGAVRAYFLLLTMFVEYQLSSDKYLSTFVFDVVLGNLKGFRDVWW